MSEEQVQVQVQVSEKVRGDRGEVGVATASATVKRLWHEATYNLVEVGDKTNPHRQAWLMRRGAPSLKKWVREQTTAGNKEVKEWAANKAGAKNLERSDKNVKRIFEEKTASKAARRKAGAGKQAKPKADAAVAK